MTSAAGLRDVPAAGVDLYWLPLGAGGYCVRLCGRAYELLVACRAGRSRFDLYHSALRVRVPEGAFVIETAPVADGRGWARGVVAEGPVGSRLAGGLRVFRYELRCWRDGVIPDAAEAVASPQRLTVDPASARRLLAQVTSVPMPVWGRDDAGAGEMWNSNSVIAWLLVRSGLNVDSIAPPTGGRAPGWHAGVVVARQAG